MRFVDEYRDPAMARALVARITALAWDLVVSPGAGVDPTMTA